MKSASQRQEARVAKRFGGRTTPGSGNQWDRKNDVRTPTTSFELKVTSKKQYTLKAADLVTAERNALKDGRDFVFGIEMEGRNWVLLAEDDYAEMAARPTWSWLIAEVGLMKTRYQDVLHDYRGIHHTVLNDVVLRLKEAAGWS